MDGTSHNLSLLIARVEQDIVIIGPVVGDIVWYFDTWVPGRHAFEQGNIQDALTLAELADILVEETTGEQ